MAITHVGTETAADSGAAEAVTSLQVDYPAGLQAGDVLHLFASMPKSMFWTQVPNGFSLAKETRFAVPPGWTLVHAEGPTNYHYSQQWHTPYIILLRRIATGDETGSVTLPITLIQHRTEDVAASIVPAAVVTAHRGVVAHLIYGPVAVNMPIASGFHSPLDMSSLVYYEDSVGLEFNTHSETGITPGQQMSALTDPYPAPGTPPANWPVRGQARTQALANGRANRAAVLEAETSTGDPLNWPVGASNPYSMPRASLRVVLTEESHGPPVDSPPQPGQPGVTGSGWHIPEWVGRDRQIDSPLVTTYLGEDEEGDLVPIVDPEESPLAVGLDATFNGLGACTSAQAAFPASPGTVPYQHALAFALRTTADPESAVTWWAGVVKNTRYDNGLHIVDLEGFWSLFNEAAVQTEEDEDENDVIAKPDYAVLTDALFVGVGDPTTMFTPEPVDALQSWSEHLNNRFRHTPDAAWGVGPDRVFIMGNPEQGGVLELDAEGPAVVRVEPGEFILPSIVTDWWAEDSNGDILTGSGMGRGILAPRRIVNASVDGSDNLMVPAEAGHPLTAGPTYELEVSGVAVPPLRVINLPGGVSQMVASARVSINVGEEGSMPRVTTTLTTVALPYEQGGS